MSSLKITVNMQKNVAVVVENTETRQVQNLSFTYSAFVAWLNDTRVEAFLFAPSTCQTFTSLIKRRVSMMQKAGFSIRTDTNTVHFTHYAYR